MISRTQKFTPINFNSSNGTAKMKPITDKIQTALISIATTGIISLIGFAFKINSTLVRIEEKQIDEEKSIDNLNIKMNNIQLDTRDTRDRVIKLETLKNQK